MTCHCIEDEFACMRDGASMPGRFADHDAWRDWYRTEMARLGEVGGSRIAAWYRRARNATHPATYGATDHELASDIGFALCRHADGGELITQAMQADECHADPRTAWRAKLINMRLRLFCGDLTGAFTRRYPARA